MLDLRAFTCLGGRAKEATRCLGAVQSVFTGLEASQYPAFVLELLSAKKERSARIGGPCLRECIELGLLNLGRHAASSSRISSDCVSVDSANEFREM